MNRRHRIPHIQEHFDLLLSKFIGIMFHKKYLLSKCVNDIEKNKIKYELFKIKIDILYNENKSTIPKYINFIEMKFFSS